MIVAFACIRTSIMYKRISARNARNVISQHDQSSVKSSMPLQQFPPENAQIHNDTEDIRPVHLRKSSICRGDRSYCTSHSHTKIMLSR